MGLEDIRLSEMNHSKTANIACFLFYEISNLIKSMETENIIVVAKGSEEEELENWSQWVNGFSHARWKSSIGFLHTSVYIVSNKIHSEIIKKENKNE